MRSIIVEAKDRVYCIADRIEFIAFEKKLGHVLSAIVWIAQGLSHYQREINRGFLTKSQMSESVIKHMLQTLDVIHNIFVEHGALMDLTSIELINFITYKMHCVYLLVD